MGFSMGQLSPQRSKYGKIKKIYWQVDGRNPAACIEHCMTDVVNE